MEYGGDIYLTLGTWMGVARSHVKPENVNAPPASSRSLYFPVLLFIDLNLESDNQKSKGSLIIFTFYSRLTLSLVLLSFYCLCDRVVKHSHSNPVPSTPSLPVSL